MYSVSRFLGEVNLYFLCARNSKESYSLIAILLFYFLMKIKYLYTVNIQLVDGGSVNQLLDHMTSGTRLSA